MIICKKNIIVISFLLIFLFILGYIGFSVYNHINITKDFYTDISSTFKSVFNSFNKSLSEFQKAKSLSYTVNIDFKNISSLPFSTVTLSNNYNDKYCELSFDNLNIKGKNTVDLNAFVTKDKIGFYFDKNPEFYYTAKGEKFRSKWNSSLYGKFAKIPDFVPETINYNKINTIILPQNIVKVFLGMGLGKEKIKIKDIINNVSISTPKPYILYQNGKKQNAQIVDLTISKEYLVSLVDKLKKSSENADFNYLNTFFINAHTLLKDSPEKGLKINFIILNNKLLWAETSARLSKGLANVKLNFDYNEISFVIKQLMPNKSSKADCILKFNSKSPSDISLQFVKRDKELVSFNLHKNIDNTVTSQISYCNKKSNRQFIAALYSPDSQKFNSDVPTKNIYSLSLSDILSLYSKVDSSHNLSLRLFSFR